MSLARQNFLSRLSTLRESLADVAVSDGAPTDIKKNAIAGMLRSGLAVLTFAITEDFIRDRTAEALRGFISSNVSFNKLSEPLQNAVTISALKGILFRSELQEKTSRPAWVLTEIKKIANAQTNVNDLSQYSFGQTRSNLQDSDLTDILKAFRIKNGWTSITATAKKIGLGGVLDYCQAFKEIASRRHRAAHSVAAQIPLSDLINSTNTVLGICASFDLLLSQALSLHNTGTPPNNIGELADILEFRFISPHPTQIGKFREQTLLTPSDSRHTVKVYASLEDALIEAIPNSRSRKEQLVLLGTNGIPERWETW